MKYMLQDQMPGVKSDFRQKEIKKSLENYVGGKMPKLFKQKAKQRTRSWC